MIIIERIKYILLLAYFLCSINAYSADLSLIILTYQDDKEFYSFFSALRQDPLFATYDVLVESIVSPSHKEDEISAVVKPYCNVRVIKLYGNPGIGRMLNVAVHAAYGEYLMMLTPSLRYMQYAFDLMIEHFAKDDQVEMIFTNYYQTPYRINNFYDMYFGKISRTLIKKKYPYLDKSCPIMWKKSIHKNKRYGFFDDSYCAAADLEFWVRAQKKGLKVSGYQKFCAVKRSDSDRIRSSFDYISEYNQISSFYSEN